MDRDRDLGVPLAHYRTHKAGLLLICRGCHHQRSLELEAVIRRLERRGGGGARTGIREAARFVRDPCPRCGGTSFETRPDFSAGRVASGPVATGRDADYPFKRGG